MTIAAAPSSRQPERPDIAAVRVALTRRLHRLITKKYVPAKGRLQGYDAAVHYTGLCPDHRRHRWLIRKLEYWRAFIRDAEATLRVLKADP